MESICYSTEDGKKYLDFDCKYIDTIQHDVDIFALTLSSDGTKLAAGGEDYIIVFDVTAVKSIASIPHDNSVLALAFSPDSTRLAIGFDEGSVIIYSTISKQQVLSFQLEESITTLAFSYDGQKLAVGGDNGMVAIYNVVDENLMQSIECLVEITSVAFFNDGNKICVGTNGHGMDIYDVTSGEKVCTFCEENGVTNVVISSDESMIAITGISKKLIIVDYEHRKIHSIPNDDWILSVSFSLDDSKIITGDASGKVAIYDLSSGNEVKSFPSKKDFDTGTASLGATKIAFGGENNKIEIFQILPIEKKSDLFAKYYHNEEEKFKHSSKAKFFADYIVERISNHTSVLSSNNDRYADKAEDICISFLRRDSNDNFEGAGATVFVNADEQSSTKLSDVLKRVPESSGLFDLDEERMKNGYVMRIVVKEKSVILQAEQCDITIESFRRYLKLDSKIMIEIRFDLKKDFGKAQLPF